MPRTRPWDQRGGNDGRSQDFFSIRQQPDQPGSVLSSGGKNRCPAPKNKRPLRTSGLQQAQQSGRAPVGHARGLPAEQQPLDVCPLFDSPSEDSERLRREGSLGRINRELRPAIPVGGVRRN